MDDRILKSEDRGLRSEIRGQKTDDRLENSARPGLRLVACASESAT